MKTVETKNAQDGKKYVIIRDTKYKLIPITNFFIEYFRQKYILKKNSNYIAVYKKSMFLFVRSIIHWLFRFRYSHDAH